MEIGLVDVKSPLIRPAIFFWGGWLLFLLKALED